MPSGVSDSIRLKLTIAYDGSAYQGWQGQPNGLGVQNQLDQAVRKIFGDCGRCEGSSRTDTGVHALGMVAHVDIPLNRGRMDLKHIPLALNSSLPPDVRVIKASIVASDFHARFDARGKEYRYHVWNGPVMNPLLLTQAWHVPVPLDFNAMKSASTFMEGTHDFRSFSANRGYELKDAVRHLSRCEVRRLGPRFTFVIEGDGFLYKMCRGLVGTLVQVGQGKISAEEIPDMLRGEGRETAGMNAPAHGLVLQRVFYQKKSVKTPS